MIHPRKPENIGIVADYGDSLETFQEERLLKEYATLPCVDWRGATWPPNLLHRDIWDLVGGYSIEFSPGMGSDPDLTAKLWMAGVRHFKGLAASRVYHFETKSTERIVQNDARMQFMLKWGIANSVLREQMTQLGQPWDTPAETSLVTPRTRLRYRLKVILNLINGGQLGPIEPLQ